jgi:hypothetical protein
LRQKLDIPVCALLHPAEQPGMRFSWEQYLANPEKKLVQLGYWLRRLHSIQQIPSHRFLKLWLIPTPKARTFRDDVERLHINQSCLTVIGRYAEQAWIELSEYDLLLASNIAFVDYYDVSASNAIVECIVRRTPLLVNRLPAVVEYLGREYPLYFDDLAHAANLIDDDGRVRDAHLYLGSMDPGAFSADGFRRSFLDSEIYQSL